MRISFEITEDTWDYAASQIERRGRPIAPWQFPVEFSRPDLLVIGPEGVAWFEDGRHRYGYGGSLLYLADGLNEWLQSDAETYVIEADSLYQSSQVDLRVVGTSVEVAFGRAKGSDVLHVALDDARRAVEVFLEEFGSLVVLRLPGLRDFPEVTWLPFESDG